MSQAHLQLPNTNDQEQQQDKIRGGNMTLVTMLTVSMLRHFPGKSGSKNLALGVQTNIATKVIAV